MSNTDLSEFFSLVSKEKSANETRLKEQIEKHSGVQKQNEEHNNTITRL